MEVKMQVTLKVDRHGDTDGTAGFNGHNAAKEAQNYGQVVVTRLCAVHPYRSIEYVCAQQRHYALTRVQDSPKIRSVAVLKDVLQPQNCSVGLAVSLVQGEQMNIWW